MTALQAVIEAHAFDSAQVVYNMLNPPAASELPILPVGVGLVGIRVLGGGALSGTERHPIASPPPELIGSLKALHSDNLQEATR
jgi:L-galactose dehydrogenase/L-glyceraldehyde 3-phosphate reductase